MNNSKDNMSDTRLLGFKNYRKIASSCYRGSEYVEGYRAKGRHLSGLGPTTIRLLSLELI